MKIIYLYVIKTILYTLRLCRVFHYQVPSKFIATITNKPGKSRYDFQKITPDGNMKLTLKNDARYLGGKDACKVKFLFHNNKNIPKSYVLASFISKPFDPLSKQLFRLVSQAIVQAILR